MAATQDVASRASLLHEKIVGFEQRMQNLVGESTDHRLESAHSAACESQFFGKCTCRVGLLSKCMVKNLGSQLRQYSNPTRQKRGHRKIATAIKTRRIDSLNTVRDFLAISSSEEGTGYSSTFHHLICADSSNSMFGPGGLVDKTITEWSELVGDVLSELKSALDLVAIAISEDPAQEPSEPAELESIVEEPDDSMMLNSSIDIGIAPTLMVEFGFVHSSQDSHSTGSESATVPESERESITDVENEVVAVQSGQDPIQMNTMQEVDNPSTQSSTGHGCGVQSEVEGIHQAPAKSRDRLGKLDPTVRTLQRRRATLSAEVNTICQKQGMPGQWPQACWLTCNMSEKKQMVQICRKNQEDVLSKRDLLRVRAQQRKAALDATNDGWNAYEMLTLWDQCGLTKKGMESVSRCLRYANGGARVLPGEKATD